MMPQNVNPETGRLSPDFISKYPIVVSRIRITDEDYNSETIICIKDESVGVEACEEVVRTGSTVDRTRVLAVDSLIKRCETIGEAIEVIRDMDYTIDKIAKVVNSFVTKLKEKLFKK